MTNGQPFNPYGKFRCAFVPVSLCASSAFTQGAKLLFGRLALYAGRDGRCYPAIDSLSADLGVDQATVKRWLKELADGGLIDRKRRGRGHTAECIFVWSDVLTASLKSAGMRHQDTDLNSAGMRHQGDITAQECAVKNDMTAQIYTDDSAGMRCAYKEEASKEMSKASEQQQIVADALVEGFVRFKVADVAPLLAAAEKYGADAATLAMFVREKSRTRKPETVQFFTKAIPQDLPGWMHRNRSRLALLTMTQERPSTQPEQTSPVAGVEEEGIDDAIEPSTPLVEQIPSACATCRNQGFVLLRGCTVEVSVQFCECPAGERLRASKGENWSTTETERLRDVERKLAVHAANSPGCAPKQQRSMTGGITMNDISRAVTEARQRG